jgi:hypothetical protein
VCGLKHVLNLWSLVMGQPPKRVPPARRKEITPNLIMLPVRVNPDLYAKIMRVLEKKIRLKGLNPPFSGSVRGNLIKVGSFQNEPIGVIPETKS